MTGYLTDYSGQRYKLPVFLSWEINHTDGESGTDSFEIKIPYHKTMKQPLEDAVYFTLEYKNETVFHGIIDEYEVRTDENGRTVNISGRGMGARLLDNRCVGASFDSCTLSDMLRNYVTPYGVKTGEMDAMPPMYGYSVSVNESCLSALSGYTRFAGNVAPRFSKEGKLMLTRQKGARLHFEERFALLDEIVSDMAKGNKLNLLLYDGEYTYVHTNYKNSLFYVEKENIKFLYKTFSNL